MFVSVVYAVSTVFPLSKAFWLSATGLYLMERPPTGTDLLIFESLGQQVNTVSTYPQIPPQNFYPISWVSSLFFFFFKVLFIVKNEKNCYELAYKCVPCPVTVRRERTCDLVDRETTAFTAPPQPTLHLEREITSPRPSPRQLPQSLEQETGRTPPLPSSLCSLPCSQRENINLYEKYGTRKWKV